MIARVARRSARACTLAAAERLVASLAGLAWARLPLPSGGSGRGCSTGRVSGDQNSAQRIYLGLGALSPVASEPPGGLRVIGRIGLSDYYRHTPLGQRGYRAGEGGRMEVRYDALCQGDITPADRPTDRPEDISGWRNKLYQTLRTPQQLPDKTTLTDA